VKRTKFVPLVLCVVCAVATVLLAPPADAKNNGFPSESCGGCHRGGQDFKPRITFEPARIEPGQTVVLTLHVPNVNGPVSGVYLQSNRKGVFSEISGGGLQKISDTDATHNAPRVGAGGESTFQIRWTAPAMPGGVEFDMTAVSGNRDGGSRGDSEGYVRANLAFGCEGVDGYLDQDGDGWGVPDLRGPQRFCALPSNYTMRPGDCNDYDAKANPEGKEICNLYDDDCDGMVNEGLDSEIVYRDMDGDGYGGRLGEMKMGCAGGFGWSSTRDDCDDNNREVHPKAKEVCNLRDDDCDNRADNGARAACGEGWCRRLAPSCEASSCVPGAPRAEMCNAFDDDCDGVIDNGENLCVSGKVCYKGLCLTKEEAAEVAASMPDAGAPDGPSSSGTGGIGGGMGAGGGSGSAGAGTGTGGTPAQEEPARPKLGCSYGERGPGWPAALLLLAVMLGRMLLRPGGDRRTGR
jgi:hypothetical protein